MSPLVGGNLDRMTGSRRAIRQSRGTLESLSSQANGISPPAEPAALRGRIREALAQTSRSAQSGQRQLGGLEQDLARRQALLVIADTVGSFTPLKAAPRLGSTAYTPDGIIPDTPLPGLGSDALGALFGGLENSLERYSKLFNEHSITTMRIEREIVRSFKVTMQGGRTTITELTREVDRIHVSTNVTRTAVKYAAAARHASKALGALGHVDNAVMVVRSLGVKGPERASAIGGALGKAGGGVAGAAQGAAWGATAGTFVGGPIGTIVGGGLGAAVGGFVGSKIGNTAGAAIGEGARQTGKALGDAADKAGDTARKAADHAKHAFSGAKHKLGNLF